MRKTSLVVGGTLQLEPQWSSANDAIATVDDAGNVTAVAPGVVEIYCTVEGLSVATIVSVAEASLPVPETPDV